MFWGVVGTVCGLLIGHVVSQTLSYNYPFFFITNQAVVTICMRRIRRFKRWVFCEKGHVHDFPRHTNNLESLIEYIPRIIKYLNTLNISGGSKHSRHINKRAETVVNIKPHDDDNADENRSNRLTNSTHHPHSTHHHCVNLSNHHNMDSCCDNSDSQSTMKNVRSDVHSFHYPSTHTNQNQHSMNQYSMNQDVEECKYHDNDLHNVVIHRAILKKPSANLLNE